MDTSAKSLSNFATLRTYSAIVALVFIAILSSTPVDLGGQALLATITIVVFITMSWVEPAGGPLRVFMFLLTVFTSMRYMLWRAAETLPSDNPLPFIFGLVLFGAEVYGFLILLLSTFLSVDVFERKAEPAPVSPDRTPSVDILIPSYNEDEDMLEVTIRAALAVNYPAERLNVYLCDDGGTVAKRNQADPARAAEAQSRFENLQVLCERTGAKYLTRDKNEHAKAGNINSALKVTSGELILILDADHVPTSDILNRTVGHFVRDPKMFLVQTPHFMLNPDPLERNLDTFDDMPSENEMFYSVIQKGLDGFNASFFCGSAALLRRSCLMEIGGIQGDTITEDAETALELHSRGYRSAYVDRPMVAGLSPETFSGFIIQRMRWAQGMVQIFLLKNPIMKKGLTFAQRIGYMNSCFYWFFPLARMAFIIAPLVYLIFGLQIFHVGVGAFLAYGAPHVVGAVLLSSTLYGRRRWILVSELYEVIQAVHCSGAILQVFRNPRAPTFAVTPKGESLDNNFISPLATPFYWLIGLVLLGEIMGIGRMLADPEQAGYVAVALVWNTLHLLLLIGALGALYERSQRRIFPRIDRDAEVALGVGDTSVPVKMTDISVTGMGVRQKIGARHPLKIGDVVLSDARDMGAPTAFPLSLRVCSAFERNGEVFLGLQFMLESPEQWRAVVSLVYSRSQAWGAFQDRRTKASGMAGKLGFLARRSFKNGAEHLQAVWASAKS